MESLVPPGNWDARPGEPKYPTRIHFEDHNLQPYTWREFIKYFRESRALTFLQANREWTCSAPGETGTLWRPEPREDSVGTRMLVPPTLCYYCSAGIRPESTSWIPYRVGMPWYDRDELRPVCRWGCVVCEMGPVDEDSQSED